MTVSLAFDWLLDCISSSALMAEASSVVAVDGGGAEYWPRDGGGTSVTSYSTHSFNCTAPPSDKNVHRLS